VFLTPLMGGADGISEMTRQWVRVVESRVGCHAGRLEVWSLDDRSHRDEGGSGFKTARGGRIRFASFALRDGVLSAADTIVIVMHLQLLPVALPLVWRGARLVTLLMGIEAWTPLDALQEMAMRRAWKTVAISAHTAQRFRDANPSLEHLPITVCHPGAPASARAVSDHVEGRYALIVGRMNTCERYKGHDILIELWPALRRSVPDAQLIVAGDGDDVSRLRKKADETCDGITFLGRVDRPKLASLYRDATFFVMPSTDEGFGLVYLEAMRAGIPCIAARGAAEEIITDGGDGLIVNAGDRDELLAAMVHLFVDTQARMRLGAAAAQRVSTCFDTIALERRVCGALELEAH
jgi:phosphatidyl-myo-inositol dimannoside synthase